MPFKVLWSFRQALCAYSLKFELPENSPLAYLNTLAVIAPEPFTEYFNRENY
ncbi:MAG: hypothetical protein NC177_07120 [Ruminococcus flavefaciens]|nr:hypothetical protein [Ruminococcus flavefaciens]